LSNKKSIKVAVLTTSFPLGKDSTSGIFVQRLVKNLPPWVEANVITPCSSRPVDYDLCQNYHVQCFRYAPRTWQILAHESGGIPVALRHRKILILLLPIFICAMFIACFRASKTCDLIHANWSVNGLIAGFVGVITNTPVITTLRGEDITKAGKSMLYDVALRLCIRLNKKLITVSEAIKNQLSNKFPKQMDKFVFLPNGVDNNFLKVSRSKSRIQVKNEDVLQILTIGSLIPRKGVKDIIKALKLIKESKTGFRLSIIGTGIEENNLKQLVVSSGMSGQVSFLGNISPQDIPHHFSKADVFILASYSEGRPNVILESLAAGVPVIATQIDGVTELIKENITGLLFLPGDSEQLAKQIGRLKNNRELGNELAKRGQDLILGSGLLWSKVGNRYAEIYNHVRISDKDEV
jgi:glycosyltransferase involved in cell wall biosynthesis